MQLFSFYRFHQDLHTLERLLRGGRPGFGKSFASELLRSMRDACKDHEPLAAPMDELERAAQNFVNAPPSASVNAFELWAHMEHAIAACRRAATARNGSHRNLASGTRLPHTLWIDALAPLTAGSCMA